MIRIRQIGTKILQRYVKRQNVVLLDLTFLIKPGAHLAGSVHISARSKQVSSLNS